MGCVSWFSWPLLNPLRWRAVWRMQYCSEIFIQVQVIHLTLE